MAIETQVTHRPFFDVRRERERAMKLHRMELAFAFGSPFRLTRDEELLKRLGWLEHLAADACGPEYNFVRAWLVRN